jgi:PleD family two-component response regulator
MEHKTMDESSILQESEEQKGTHILVVDDMPTNLRTIKVILEKDYHVLLAKSGELALFILDGTKVDLVLLDIEMPDMSGFELFGKIREHPNGKDVPIIFVTSHTATDLIRSAYSVGATDYIVKPIHAEVLLKKISAVLPQPFVIPS